MKLRRSLLNVAPAVFAALFLSVIIPSLLASRGADATGPQAVSASVSRVGFGLSIATEPQVTLDVSPKPAGAMTVVSSIVSPATTAPNGYTLYLQMTGDNANTNALINSVDDNVTIASSGTYASPVALAEGKWGYAIPGNSASLLDTNHFDDTYTTMESATPTGSVFAAVPVYPGDAEKIAETHGPGGVDLTVYYGVNASYNTVSGSYSNKILYTALADSGSTPTMVVSPERIAGSGNIPLQLMTSLYTTKEDVDFSGYMLTPEQYAAVTAGTLDVTTLTSQKLASCTRDTSQEALTLNCRSVSLDHAGPTIIYLDVPTYDVHYADQIMLAGTEEFYTISTMQEMTPMVCKSVPTPAANADYAPTTYLTDSRDNKVYEVKKLADGNCWMTQNLAISGTTIDYTDSNLPGGASYTIPDSSDTGWCTDGAQACIDTENVLNTNNPEHPEYGTYYSWKAATAGYGTYSTTSGNVSYSVCPKGWRLPSGGTSGAFQGLVNAGYNTAALMQSEAGPNFVLSGYRDGANTVGQDNYGYYWANMPYDSTSTYRLGISESNITPAGTSGRFHGFSIRCIADSFWNIADMQDMTNDVCEAATTPLATATDADTDGSHDGQTSYVPQRTLSDIRDGNSYTIRKLADGNCWMTENLRLNFTTNTTLTPADTNIVSSWTPGIATETASNHSKWNPDESYTPESFHQIHSYSNGDNTLLTYDGDTQKIGTFYNWYTATATSGTYYKQNDLSPVDPSALYSICPKGWTIPYLGGSKGWTTMLNNSYGISSGSADARQKVTAFPFSLIIGGLYDADYGASTTQDRFGYYWSGDAQSYNYSYYLLITVASDTTHGVQPNTIYFATMPKSDGFPIRCVNK